jgi:hypothetical protein
MRLFTSGFLLIMVLWLSACGGGGSENNQTSDDRVSSLEITADVYRAMPALDQYAVMNKLLGALYKGIPAADFFDFSNGLEPLVIKSGAMDIFGVKAALKQPLIDKGAEFDRIDDKYNFQERTQPIQYPLAMLYEFPLSRDFFAAWMAYKLANTILFSPALELETCDYTDLHRVFQRLVSMIEDGASIREVVYEHMISQENWRRFRSPEDNTREMMEIFLGRFKDGEVPLASLACKNWSLTDDRDHYQLVIGYDENTEPQAILDTTVTHCTDFYMAIAQHDDLVPRITAVLVENLLTGTPEDIQQQIVDTIVSEYPQVFEDIFIPILFSRAFLIETERPAQLEERFFNIAHRISWWANANFFIDINHAWSSSTYPSLKNMKQAALTYKLGRPAEVPLDTMSFSYFHKAVREKLLLDQRRDAFNENDGGWQEEFIQVDLANDDFIKYLFLGVISRLPSAFELTTLGQIIEDRGYTKETQSVHRAMIVMDYLSRLSETYYLNALN